MNLRRELEGRFRQALAAAGAPDGAAALVMPAGRPEFGDYQVNGVMAAAKLLRTSPRSLADKVAAAAEVTDLAEALEVAGPGFINVTLRAEFLARGLSAALADDETLGVAAVAPEARRTVVVDYSAPNLAKEMHVGHLRSTIIGDALGRTLEFLGHRVIRQNHVGDWGTQFGMLACYLDHVSARRGGAQDMQIPDLEAFYRGAKELFDADPEFADSSRRYVVRLQSGDEHVTSDWRAIVENSLAHCRRVYERLGVGLRPEDVRGESAYNDDLPNVLADLDRAGLLTESRGAQCVFLDEFRGTDGQPLPLIVRKSDEGYLYATTDLAAIRWRVRRLRADRVLYVVDSRQALHFRMVFAAARKAGFAPPAFSLEHVGFGMMLGSDRRPFATREGGTVKLTDLLDEAVRRARDVVDRKSPDLPDEQGSRIAEAVGIGAVKYADLCQNRASDYVFNWDKMLALDGNTAPYMQYAYARVRSIFRKGGLDEDRVPAEVAVVAPAERTLALKLVQFGEAVEAVAADCYPHLLCAYLYDLAGAFMGFYETCPVLQADRPSRTSRLAMCLLTARTIQRGLSLLGIDTIERM